MMRVMHIISDTNVGGAGVYLLNLLRNANKNDFVHEILLPGKSALTPFIRELVPGTAVTELRSLADKSADFAAVFEIRRLIKEKRPDIIHTHAAFAGRIAGRLTRGAKIIATRHTIGIYGTNNSRCRLYKHVKNIANNITCDRYIAVSPACKDALISCGVKEKKIEVIQNGTERQIALTDSEKMTARREYGIPEDAFVAALIGRMAHVKGHAIALSAAVELSSDSSIYMVFAGAGELYEQIRKEIANRELCNVITLGFIKDVYKVMNIMDIGINASYEEASSLALIEGMSLGKPAVVSDAGGNPYVIEDGINGLVFKKGDAGSLADCIKRLRSEKGLMERLSEGASSRYEECFTAKKMTEKTEHLYRECIAGKKL